MCADKIARDASKRFLLLSCPTALSGFIGLLAIPKDATAWHYRIPARVYSISLFGDYAKSDSAGVLIF